MRSSSLVAAALHLAQNAPQLIPALREDIQHLNQAKLALFTEDIETARASLIEIESSSTLPKPVKAFVHMMQGLVALGDLEPERCIVECAKAEWLHPDFPVLKYLRARALNQAERYEDAIVQSQLFLEELGGDADASAELATSLLGLERNEEALQAIRAGLDDDPSSITLLLMLLDSLPEDEKHEFADRLKQLPDAIMEIDAICGDAWYEDDMLELMVNAFREIAPDDPSVAYYQAQVHLLREEPEQAVVVLEPIMGLIHDREDSAYFEEFYRSALLACGRWNEVYSEAEDKPQAFQWIADDFLYKDKRESLEKLIARHRELLPDDPELPGYEGQLAMLEEDWPRAIRAFREAIMLQPDDGWDYSLVRAMYYSDQSLEALRTLEPVEDIFDQLMSLACYDESPRHDLVEHLFREYKERDPTGTVGAIWQARLAYDNADYAAAIDVLEKNAEAARSNENYRWEFDNLLVRALTQNRQFDEAQVIAQRIYQRDEDPFELAIVAAGRGDVNETEKWLSILINKHYYETYDLYYDDIIGPALKSEAFSRIKKKFSPAEVLMD